MPTIASHLRVRPRVQTRGMSLLEVMLAVLLLTIAALSITFAVNSIMGMESNGRKRLGAYEIANRLMLMYLDDPESLPSRNLDIEYGNYRFRYDLEETPSKMEINRAQETSGSTLLALDRYVMVGVTIYDAGEEAADLQGEALASLSRMVDPFAPRNPDTLESFGKDPSKINKLVTRLFQDKTPTGSQGRPNQPQTPQNQPRR